MPRDARLYLEDMLKAIDRIVAYTADLDLEGFTVDAVLRNLEVIGESSKRLPEELKQQAPAIEWRKIAGLRDVLAHAYFAVDLGLVWDVVGTKLGPLRCGIQRLLDSRLE
jgi:uncharacterized protein with HEPN domain